MASEQGTEPTKQREAWGSRLGLILAAAGSAIGLGNFLRFPVQAATNGGGVFMIPYCVAFLLLGIPLVWIEWTMGRFGGIFGHGAAPGIFHSMGGKSRFIKYFGIFGIFCPTVVYVYYVYVESWLLGYSLFSAAGLLSSVEGQEGMLAFLKGYQGIESNRYFSSILPAYAVFLVTFALNIWVVYRGISGGIERLNKFAMPVLMIFGITLVVRVLTLGTPDPAKPHWNLANGLGFLWNPDFSALASAKVWLAAAGQIFYTLSVGLGILMVYSSYLKKNQDVALSGLTSASTNEFAEVVIGGSIVIPAAFVFFGPAQVVSVAQSGSFNLGFVTMPLIFHKVALGAFFSTIWFLFLFLAGITSSVALMQPAISFLEDELGFSRKKAVALFGAATFLLCQPVIFLLGRGVIDEFDFWAGTFFIVLLATIEVILFAWVFGMDRAWDEMHRGA